MEKIYFLLFVIIGSLKAAENDTLVQDSCLLCVENGTHRFYKTLWHAMSSPYYVCRKSPNRVSPYSLVVGIYCNPEDCENVTIEPVSRVYGRDDMKCPGDSSMDFQPTGATEKTAWDIWLIVGQLLLYIVMVVAICTSRMDAKRRIQNGLRPSVAMQNISYKRENNNTGYDETDYIV